MDAVTYPTPRIVETLNRDFVCFTLDVEHPDDDGRQLLRSYRLLWEPGVVFFEPRGAELRRFVGYRSPEDFLAELCFAKALTDYLYRRFEQAAAGFALAARQSPDAAIAPEALYWRAIATYRVTGRDLAALEQAWGELRERYPHTTWSRSADVLDFKPTGRRLS